MKLTITTPDGHQRFTLLVDGADVARYEFAGTAGYPVVTEILDRDAWDRLGERVNPQLEAHMLYNEAVFG